MPAPAAAPGAVQVWVGGDAVRIQDARPGDVLRDKGGALWLKGKRRSRCIYDPCDPEDTGDNDSKPAESIRRSAHVNLYAPFTRLVPEVTP